MLARLLLLEELLATDACADLDAVHRRDRAIGRALDARTHDEGRRVLAWVERRAPEQAIDDAERALGAARTVLAVAGLALGVIVATGVLYFDGASRVNVLTVLALLCGLPALGTALSAVLMLPDRWRRAVPPLAALQDAVAGLSPGRALLRVARRFSPALRERVARWHGGATAAGRVYGAVVRWTALHASQVFAIALMIGILTAFLARVIFSDLAFGWSTTLETDAAALHGLTVVLAAPWSAWLPDAAPSAGLVEATRYFRLDPAPPAGAAERLGGWWPFIAMCIVVYGLLPRVVLFAIGRAALARAVLRTATVVPGVPEFVFRLDSDVVETRSETEEAGAAPAAREASETAAAPIARAACVAIEWSEVGLDDAALGAAVRRACGLTVGERLAAGGSATLEADREALARLDGETPAVAVVVKAWEPPLAEFVDFLADVRAAIGAGRPIAIVAVAEDPERAPADAMIGTWRRHMAHVGDPWLSVHAGGAHDA